MAWDMIQGSLDQSAGKDNGSAERRTIKLIPVGVGVGVDFQGTQTALPDRSQAQDQQELVDQPGDLRVRRIDLHCRQGFSVGPRQMPRGRTWVSKTGCPGS